MKVTIALLVASTGYFANEAFAEVSENQAFLLEGSGFAVTEDIIETSEIDLGLSSQDRRGSSINFVTEDGLLLLVKMILLFLNWKENFCVKENTLD